MPRITHGSSISLETVKANTAAVEALNAALDSPVVLAPPRRLTQFGYLFPDLQVEEHLLPPGAETIEDAGIHQVRGLLDDITPFDHPPEDAGGLAVAGDHTARDDSARSAARKRCRSGEQLIDA